MTGGRGNDQFVFQPEEVRTFNLTFERPIFGNIAGANQVTVTAGGYGGADVITDFAAGPGTGDIVKLVALDLGSTVTIEQVGANVRITIAGTTSPDGLGASTTTNQNAAQTITINNINILDFLAVGSEDLEVNGQIINTATSGLAVLNPNLNNAFRFTVGARQGRNIDLSRTGIIGTRLDADFAPDGIPFPSVNNDTIVGTQGNDVIAGLAGNDSINAASGNDTVFGNAGDDTIFGRGGVAAVAVNAPVSPDNGPFTGSSITVTVTDVLYGDSALDSLQSGNDVIFGDGPGSSNEGPDFIDAGPGNDSVSGGGGDDVIFGGSGNDTLSGDGGNDTIYGGTGNDSIRGNDGTDILFGGDGNDTINGDNGNDSIQGNAGNDYIEGDDGDDTIFGNEGNDTIYGGAGNDSIQGNAGSDTLVGGTGFDTVSYADFDAGVTVTLPEPGFTANATNAGNADVDVISEFEAITGGSGNDVLTGNSGNNILAGGAGNDNINGGDGNDTIFGDDGNDILVGGSGNDSLIGGLGNDLYIVDSAGDAVVENPGAGNDTVQATASISFVGTTNLNNIEVLDIGANTVTITGAQFASLTTISANGGNLVVTDITNLATFPGNKIIGSIGNVSVTGGVNDDTITGFGGNDSLNGLGGNDIIAGQAGNDTITGGPGADTLTGGSGADVFVFAIGDSPANAPTIDVITDFAQGVDKIKVSAPFGPGTYAGSLALLVPINSINALFGDPSIAAVLAGPPNFVQVNVLTGAIAGSYLVFDINNDNTFTAADDIISLGGLLSNNLVAADFTN
jgi:Ca2+-binding RTX toxin-like protein